MSWKLPIIIWTSIFSTLLHARADIGGRETLNTCALHLLFFFLVSKKKNKQKKNKIESLGPPLSFRKVACKLKSFYVFTFSFALFFHCMISHFLTFTTRKIRCQSPTWVGEELKENKNLLNTDGVSFSQGVKMKFKTHFKGFLFSTEGARRERRCPRTFRSSRV